MKQVIKMDVSIGQVVEVLQGMEDFAAEIQPEDENSALLVDMFDQRLQGLNSPHVRLVWNSAVQWMSGVFIQ